MWANREGDGGLAGWLILGGEGSNCKARHSDTDAFIGGTVWNDGFGLRLAVSTAKPVIFGSTVRA